MTDQRQIPKSKSWTEYRAAFDRFSIQVRKLQALQTQEDVDPCHVEAALIAVELARQEYNATRDVHARELLKQSSIDFPRPGREVRAEDVVHVKAIAELLWDLTGRPDDENWYRAEDIIRRAHPTAC